MLPKTQPNFERVSMSSQLSSSRSLKKRDWLIDQTPYFPREYQKHTIGEEKTKLLSEISTKKLENSMTRIWRNTLQRKWEVQMAQYEPEYEKFLLTIVRV